MKTSTSPQSASGAKKNTPKAMPKGKKPIAKKGDSDIVGALFGKKKFGDKQPFFGK